MDRVLVAARMQVVNPFLQIVLPWVVLVAVLVINIAVFLLIRISTGPIDVVVGSLMAIYITVFSTALQAVTQAFPFALGLSVTRREFYLGSTLLITVQAVLNGIVLALLVPLERVTGGWGVGLRFFDLPYVAQANPVAQVAVFVVPFVLVGLLGMFIGTVYLRWRQLGIYTAGLVVAVVGGGAAVLLTWTGSWPAVGRFLAGSSSVSMLAGWPLVVALLVGLGGFAALRRAAA